LVLWLIIMLFPRTVTGIFASDETLVDFASWAIRIYMAGTCIFGMQMACQYSFIALGNAGNAVFLAVLRNIILLIPLIDIMPEIGTWDKTMAIYLAEPVADVIAVTVTVIMFLTKFRKTLKSITDAEGISESAGTEMTK